MTDTPLIIQKGPRKAVIRGPRVSLLKIKNKRKDEGVWPETEVLGGVERVNAAFLWVLKGCIELPGTGKD